MSQGPEAGSEGSKARDGSLQTHSCLLCKQRKVKCDKHYPCSACTRAHVQCIFKAPAPPRRGKRKPNDLSLLARLKRYEDMLQSLGVSIENVNVNEKESKVKREAGSTADVATFKSANSTIWTGHPSSSGKLLAEEGKSLYFDNILWKSLSDELPDTNEVLNSSEDEDGADDSLSKDSPASPESSHDMIISPSSSTNIRIAHPLPSVIIRLWQIFVDAVNPLCKIVHEPTTYASIIAATADLSNIPRNLEALMFSIYALSVFTLEPSECESLFAGEKRSVVLARYQLATRLALQRASLLKSADTMTLTAWLLYLFGIRDSVDPRILWIYTGIAVRVAHRIGMHRDGSHLNISPFETEMRRRIWGQCVILDSHASQLSGSGHGVSSETWDAKLPLNINDEQIWPEMTEPPQPQEGATQMYFCMIRLEFGKVFRQANYMITGGSSFWAHPSHILSLEVSERDRIIDEAEKTIADKWLRHADPFNDLHVLSMGVARTAIASMRLMIHHPRQYPDGGASLPQEEKDMVFTNAARIIEYDRKAHISTSLRKYRWHVAAFFQLNAFILVLNELCHRTSGAQVEHAWQLVADVYKHHPDLLDGSKKTVAIALTNLTLKAWGKYSEGKQLLAPDFIIKMHARKDSVSQRSRTLNTPSANAAFQSSTARPSMLQPEGGQQTLQSMGSTPSQFMSPSSGTAGIGTRATTLGTPSMGYQDTTANFSDASGNLFGGLDPASMNMVADPTMSAMMGLSSDGTQMDWAAWDSLIQDANLEGFDDPTMGFNFEA